MDTSGATRLLAATYAEVTRAVGDLDDHVAVRPTRAAGWTVSDLLQHQLLDAQRALVALASPTREPADRDAVTYWEAFHPDLGDGGAAHADVVRRMAAAAGPHAVLAQWRDTAPAVPRAAAALDPASRVCTQGHVLTVADLMSTLLVEACVHLLDLGLELSVAPPAAALAHTREVLAGLLGELLPVEWDDTEAVLRGTGRSHLDDPRYPLLG